MTQTSNLPLKAQKDEECTPKGEERKGKVGEMGMDTDKATVTFSFALAASRRQD
jgi:hypothetical protein